MSNKDGGFAFPHWDGPNGDCHNGLTLRDYFAAKAMQGYLSSPQESQLGQEARGNDAKCAEWAYQLADAMLAARAKP